MNRRNSPFISQALLRGIPVLFLGVLLAVFGTLSSRFLTGPNLQAILIQSSWLIVVALGMNLVLLTAGVDLSVGVAMYLAAVAVGMGLADAPVWLGLVAAVSVGALFGAINGLVIVRLNVPAFIVTLATTFIGRGIGIFISSTKIVYASEPVAALGRASIGGIPVPVVFALAAILVSWVLLKVTPLGPYIRTIGADREGARRAGVPVGVGYLGGISPVRRLCRAGRVRLAEPDVGCLGGVRPECRVPGHCGCGAGWNQLVWRARHVVGANRGRDSNHHHPERARDD
jgi:ribose transport system permease protein